MTFAIADSKLAAAPSSEDVPFDCPDCAVQKSASEKYVFKQAGKRKTEKGKSEPKDSFRCRDCHKLRTRICRIVAKRNQQEEWKDISKEAKQEFFAEHADKFGDGENDYRDIRRD